MTDLPGRPIFTALATRHAAFARGGEDAKRFLPSVSPFACGRDDSARSIAALGDLAEPGETLVFLQADPVLLPDTLVAGVRAEGVQMVAAGPVEAADDPELLRLGPADAGDMLALAALTRPGPFTMDALRLGAFWGVRHGGQLVAMAGERLGQPGLTEVSGVCVHPDRRGKGLARRLSLQVAKAITRRGERPFLHAYADNAAAIGLYRSIGFEISRAMHVCRAGRAT